MPQSHTYIHMRYERMYPLLMSFCSLLLIFGFSLDTPENIIAGLHKILFAESSLITDYIALAGPGAAFVNSAIVTTICILILHISEERLNGMTLMIVGLMSGFSLFGKNFLNILPIIFGTWLYCRSRKEHFSKYAVVAMMATSLSPIVSYISLANGFGSLLWGILTGMLIGFIVPPLASYTYRIQNGMNLYNSGFACGLIAMILIPLISSLGAEPTRYTLWATGYNHLFAPYLIMLCLLLIFGGFFAFGLPFWAVWAGYRRLLQTSGRSPSDYIRMFGPSPVMVNTGVNGLIAMSMILAIGGDLNGPTLGGIFTVMGFGSFGKHALNILPPMIGVIIGGNVFHWELNGSASQLAILFCTTLAPISGYFGWTYGILAGFLHSSLVLFTSSPVSGMNLYNNGFSGGLVAIVLYPLIIDIARHRKITIQDEDFFDPLEHDEPTVPPIVHLFLEEEAITSRENTPDDVV